MKTLKKTQNASFHEARSAQLLLMKSSMKRLLILTLIGVPFLAACQKDPQVIRISEIAPAAPDAPAAPAVAPVSPALAPVDGKSSGGGALSTRIPKSFWIPY